MHPHIREAIKRAAKILAGEAEGPSRNQHFAWVRKRHEIERVILAELHRVKEQR